MNIRRDFRLLLFASVLIAVCTMLTLHWTSVAGAGYELPEFETPALRDPARLLSSQDLLGRVVLINVWASWCVSCRGEHNVLLQLSGEDRIEIIGLNYLDGRDDALRWLAFYGDPFAAIAFDPEGVVAAKLGIEAVPQTFVIDRDGMIRLRHVGPIGANDAKRVILPLVRKLSGTRT